MARSRSLHAACSSCAASTTAYSRCSRRTYTCRSRPASEAELARKRGAERIRTAVRGFAGLCLTTRPRRRERPWYRRSLLGNPALESRRELELVRPCARALLVEVPDRVHDILHRGRPFRGLVFEPVLRLLALDDRVDDQQRDMDALVSKLRRL